MVQKVLVCTETQEQHYLNRGTVNLASSSILEGYWELSNQNVHTLRTSSSSCLATSSYLSFSPNSPKSAIYL